MQVSPSLSASNSSEIASWVRRRYRRGLLVLAGPGRVHHSNLSIKALERGDGHLTSTALFKCLLLGYTFRTDIESYVKDGHGYPLMG